MDERIEVKLDALIALRVALASALAAVDVLLTPNVAVSVTSTGRASSPVALIAGALKRATGVALPELILIARSLAAGEAVMLDADTAQKFAADRHMSDMGAVVRLGCAK